MVHSIAQKCSDNLPSYRADKYDVYRGEVARPVAYKYDVYKGEVARPATSMMSIEGMWLDQLQQYFLLHSVLRQVP